MRIRLLLCKLGLHRWIEIGQCRDHNWATHVCWWCGALKGER